MDFDRYPEDCSCQIIQSRVVDQHEAASEQTECRSISLMIWKTLAFCWQILMSKRARQYAVSTAFIARFGERCERERLISEPERQVVPVTT